MKIHMFGILITFILVGASLAISEEEKPSAWVQTIINACRPGIECDAYCVDGFGEHCYFDATQFDKNELAKKMDFSLPGEVRDMCFGIFSYSMCGKCYEKFELRVDGELKEVSCDEFLRAIEDKNKSCNNCLDTVVSGCC